MSADMVKELRERTGAGFMDCKKALAETSNDLEKAIEFLRQKGLAAASKKAGRAANDGRIAYYVHGNSKIGVLVEVNCETDFVAKTDEFGNFASNIAMHVAAASPRYLNKESVPAADVEKEKEIIRAQAVESGKSGPVLDRIVEGKIGKFYEDNCLLHQKYVKDPDKTVEDLVKETIAKLGENIGIRRFARFQLGEKLN
jgi:elongation factor Ts